MNKRFLIFAIIVMCLSVLIGICYACQWPPTAIISEPMDPCYVCIGETVDFNGLDSHDNDENEEGEIVEYYWDFGDGNDSNEASPSHDYEHAGLYTVTLEVTDDENDTDDDSCTIYVVEVGKIEIEYEAGSWDDVTDDTIVVLKGTKYTFKAFPTPSRASWPTDQPEWSLNGSSLDPPGEEEKEVTFGSVGTQTLTVMCGSDDVGKTVTINVIIPEPDRVSFVDHNPGEEHDIWDVTDPVWKRVSNPDKPASYTKNKCIKVQTHFWASEDLTYFTEVAIDVETEATGWPFISDITSFKRWPSAFTSHRSTNSLDNVIKVHEFNLKWKYKISWGTNEWIQMINTSGPHKVYAVYESPKCLYSDYTEQHLDLVCDWADGEVLVKENDIPKKIQENCFLNRLIAVVLHDPWDLETTPGECSTHARLLAEALKVLGINATDDQVGEWRYCGEHWWDLNGEWHYFWEVSGSSALTNFEGVCEVELIDESSPWTCYYDKYMGKVGISSQEYQKGNHENMWKEWFNYPPPHHKVIFNYYVWENHLPEE